MVRPPAKPVTHDLARCLQRIRRGRGTTRKLLMQQTNVPDDYAAPLLDAVGLFDSLDIGYALIGGVAAMVWGRSRYTEDIDFVAVTGHQQTFTDHPDAMRAHRFDPDCTWKLYHESGLEIDIWKDEHADGIVARAVTVTLADQTVRIAELHDLIAMKLRADRPQDDYDISEMIKSNRIDEDRLGQFVTVDQLKRFDAIKRRVSRD